MTRIAGQVIGNTSYGIGAQAPVADLRVGGQNGVMPNMKVWVNNQQHIRQNLRCFLMEAPGFFNNLSNSDQWIGTLKALFEEHAIRITGLTQTLEVEYARTPVGGSGLFQDDPIDVKMSESNIAFNFNEKLGQPCWRFHSGWIRMGIMDEHTKIPMFNAIPGITQIVEWSSEMRAATALFIEPDQTGLRVHKSWLVANMMPKTTGDITSQRDMQAAGEQVNYDIQYTGIPQVGYGVDQYSQGFLSAINWAGANPLMRSAFLDGIDPSVIAQTNVGWRETLARQVSQNAKI